MTVICTSRTRSGSRTSRTSFEGLYTDRFEPMVQLACGLVDHRAVAEEIVQDAFRQLWQRWDTITQPAGYLRTTVVNLVAVPDSADSEYLADALADVTERRRQALVLRFYGDRSIDEIAEAMHIPTGTAKSLIHRGLADLRLAIA